VSQKVTFPFNALVCYALLVLNYGLFAFLSSLLNYGLFAFLSRGQFLILKNLIEF
jgi:hypothetical protein